MLNRWNILFGNRPLGRILCVFSTRLPPDPMWTNSIQPHCALKHLHFHCALCKQIIPGKVYNQNKLRYTCIPAERNKSFKLELNRTCSSSNLWPSNSNSSHVWAHASFIFSHWKEEVLSQPEVLAIQQVSTTSSWWWKRSPTTLGSFHF